MNRRPPWLLACIAGWCLHASPAPAQARVLTPDAERGFHRLIADAARGRAGADVVNANVAMQKDTAHLDLVLRDGRHRLFVLDPADSPQGVRSRFFRIVPGEGATGADAERLAGLLDADFREDPFSIALQETRTLEAPRTSLAGAWRDNGWRGIALALVDRTMAARGWGMTLLVGGVTLVGLLLCLSMIRFGPRSAHHAEQRADG